MLDVGAISMAKVRQKYPNAARIVIPVVVGSSPISHPKLQRVTTVQTRTPLTVLGVV
jgi:hypothetical protein